MTPLLEWLSRMVAPREGPPRSGGFPAADALSRIVEPLDWTDEKRRLMVAACREMAAFHAQACPPVKRIYEKHRFAPASIRTEEDLERIPAIGAAAFKHYELRSLPLERARLHFTSSGTQGLKTRSWLDAGSIRRLSAMSDSLWRQRGLASRRRTNYALISIDPAENERIGVLNAFKYWRCYAPIADSFYAVRREADGNWSLDSDLAYRKLSEYARRREPVRLMGIPTLVWDLLQVVGRRGRLVLPPGSAVITSGGWKGAANREVARETFVAGAVELLGVRAESVVDIYTCSEHRAAHIQCPRHRFHVPAFARVLVRDPETMEALPDGRTGLLELIAPVIAMMPTLAVLSTDLGSRYPDECPCGYRSPTFAVSGRAGGGGPGGYKGCALRLDETVMRRRGGAP